MRRIRITSTDVNANTAKVEDADTGELIPGIREVTIYITPRNQISARLTQDRIVSGPRLDVIAYVPCTADAGDIRRLVKLARQAADRLADEATGNHGYGLFEFRRQLIEQADIVEDEILGRVASGGSTPPLPAGDSEE